MVASISGVGVHLYSFSKRFFDNNGLLLHCQWDFQQGKVLMAEFQRLIWLPFRFQMDRFCPPRQKIKTNIQTWEFPPASDLIGSRPQGHTGHVSRHIVAYIPLNCAQARDHNELTAIAAMCRHRLQWIFVSLCPCWNTSALRNGFLPPAWKCIVSPRIKLKNNLAYSRLQQPPLWFRNHL